MSADMRALIRLATRMANGLRALLGRDREDRELDDELKAFVDAIVDEKMGRGMSRSDAVRAARQEIGSIEAVQDRVRDAGWETVVEGAVQDLRHSLRMLRKSPGFAATIVLTLAVGVGANTAIFSVLNAVVLRDLPYRDADRLALLWTVNIRQSLRDGSSYLNFRDWKEQSRAFADMAVYRRPEFTLGLITGGEEPERIPLTFVGPGFFQVLAANPLLGRTVNAADFNSSERPVVISHGLWQQRFGSDTGAIGRPVIIDGVESKVVGVMPADFAFPNAGIQAWLPISMLAIWKGMQTVPDSRGGDQLMVIGRLAPGATWQSASSEMDTIGARLRDAYPDSNAGSGILIEPLSEHVLGPRTARSLWLLLGAVGFVMLIACANVAGLALARGAARRHEFSLRAALGASRGRLLRQSVTENLMIASLAGSLGLGLAALAATAIRTWASTALPRLDNTGLDAAAIAVAFGVSMCGVLAGIFPALRLFSVAPRAVAESGALGVSSVRSVGGRTTRRLRRVLVIAEVALAVVLLAGAGLLIRSFVRVQNIDRGFDARHTLLLQVDLPRKYDGQARKAEYFRTAFERIRALPGVVAAGAIDDQFIARQPDLRIVVEGRPTQPRDTPAPPLLRDRVVPGYFEAMGVPLLEGRLLSDHDLVPDIDRETPSVAVVNEAMARRFWPGSSAVGKRFKYGSNPGPNATWTTVVGVVADMSRQRLDEPAVPCIFWPGFGSQMDVVVRTSGDPRMLRDIIRTELGALDSEVPPYGILSVEQRLVETVAVRTLQTLLLGALAAAALVLAVIGVYGLIHHSVVEQTQEIGVRMALGATQASVLRMVLSHALSLAAIGMTLGLAGAAALGRTIGAFLYETSPVDALTFAAVPALLLAVTTIACLIPARRAARIDPMAALRVE